MKDFNNNKRIHQFNRVKWQKKLVPSFEGISLNIFKSLRIVPKVALITANNIEKDAVLKEMNNIPEIHTKYVINHRFQTYYIAQFGKQTVVMLQLGSMGTNDPAAATLTVQELISVWNVPVIIAVGIAMGMKPEKQNLGDVLISKTICNYNVNKVTENKEIVRSSIPNSGQILFNRFSNCINWKFAREDGSLCKMHTGLIITGGSLVNQKELTEKLKKQYPDAIGNEMEASGIWAAAEKNKKEWIVVKGICDWGENKKDDYQELAAAAAVYLCKKVLSNDNALDGIKLKNIKKNTKNIRINSLKLYYYRRKKRLSTQRLSELTKIPEARIISLEAFNVNKLPFDKFSFPECSINEIRKLENVLRYGRNFLEIEDKYSDFMGYLLSFYYNKKLNNVFNNFKAIVFDFDGTLTFNQTKARTSWQRIWIKLGYTIQDCNDLHMKYTDGEIEHQEWCDLTCNMFKNKGLTKNILREVAFEMTLVEGCIPTLKKLKNQGIFLYITSGSIKDVIEEVIGSDNVSIFEEIQSNRMIFDKNGLLKEILGTRYDFEGKADFIKKIANELKISPYEILFIGNSNNDELAYISGAITLCVNPNQTNSSENKKWNNQIIDMQNFEEVLKYINMGE